MANPLALNLPPSMMSGSAPTHNLGSLQQTAAQQVAAQNKAANASASSAVKSMADKGWTIPELKNFKLDPALNRANKTAVNHLQTLLSPDGMYVEMPHPTSKNTPDTNGENTAIIRENGTHKQLKSYSSQAILQLYAHNQHRASIVVDGKV